MRRWICPLCGSGLNGPERPRKDDARRYCLTCTAETGRLVERTSPALERKRAQGAGRAAELRQRKRERESLAKIEALSAPVRVDGALRKIRIDRLLDEIWKLPTRTQEAPGAQVPLITVRRGKKGHASGRCAYGHRIVVTIGQVDLAEATGLVIHEAAHAIAYETGRLPRLQGRRRKWSHHGRLFRSINRNLVTEYTGQPAPNGEGLDDYDFYQALIAHLREHPPV